MLYVALFPPTHKSLGMRLTLYVVPWLRFSEDVSQKMLVVLAHPAGWVCYVPPPHAANDCLGTDAKGRPQRVLKKFTQEVSVLLCH